jgi:hypothetical protein
VAGFEPIFHGRFWVITEANIPLQRPALARRR